MLRIIDNKRIDLTDDEFNTYENLCKAYTNGKDLFKELFHTDESGIIVSLNAPQKLFSMEIIIFVQNIMIHQHLRRVYTEHNEAMKELQELMKECSNIVKAK